MYNICTCTVCLYRPVDCDFGCHSKTLQFYELEKHVKNCTHRPVLCSHRKCQAILPFVELNGHETICEYKPTQCTFCSKIYFRKDIRYVTNKSHTNILLLYGLCVVCAHLYPNKHFNFFFFLFDYLVFDFFHNIIIFIFIFFSVCLRV